MAGLQAGLSDRIQVEFLGPFHSRVKLSPWMYFQWISCRRSRPKRAWVVCSHFSEQSGRVAMSINLYSAEADFRAIRSPASRSGIAQRAARD